MNMGDTVFMFVTTVMVMLMTPGLATFLWRYGPQQKCTQYNDA